jgi:hypothetical protein
LLLPQDIVASLIKEFNSNLQPILAEAIAKLDVDGKLSKDGLVVSLDVWLRRIMFECSGKTLFGQTWPTEDEFYNDYCIWDEDMYMILKNYPYIFTRRAILARERYSRDSQRCSMNLLSTRASWFKKDFVYFLLG